MFYLKKSLNAWLTPSFADMLSSEFCSLPLDKLPLQQSLSYGNYASSNNMSVMILSSHEDEKIIQISLGVFFTSIITGCQCSDDPTPDNEYQEYCEISLQIDKKTAYSTMAII